LYERFTDRARKVMQLANQEAQRFNRPSVGPEHILIGLVKEGQGIAAAVLKTLGVNLAGIRQETEKRIPPSPDMITMGKLPQSPQAKAIIGRALLEAQLLHHEYVGTEHLLLGLCREEDGIVADVLAAHGLELSTVRATVQNLLGHPKETSFPDVPQATAHAWAHAMTVATAEASSPDVPPAEEQQTGMVWTVLTTMSMNPDGEEVEVNASLPQPGDPWVQHVVAGDPITTPAKSLASRLVVIERVYHQRPGQQPITTQSRFSRTLESSEQQYVREVTVTEEWTPIDTGWIKSAGMLHLSNDERDAAKVVQVTVQGSNIPAWLVIPGESLRGMPADAGRLMVRCQRGTARCTLTLIPR
jgi:hypothetical protein